MTFIFFNLLVNSVFSLVIGLLWVYFFMWLFRVETGRWKVFLLSLPFIKILYDFARGVPEKSVLFSGVDPFSLPPFHQRFSIGMGIEDWSPYINGTFAVNSTDGKIYSSSIGDYVLIWLQRTFDSELPFYIVLSVLTLSCLLLAWRLVQYRRFEQKRRMDRQESQSLQKIQIERRTVDVYISPGFSGTPFTGGVLKPYICLPADAVQKLSDDEMNAVISHELGHVKYHDLVVTVLIQSIGDLFWFIPGYRWLSRKIDRLREVIADRWAVLNGIEPQALASALIKLKEIPEKPDKFVLYSAFFREKSLLKERVERLIGQRQDRKPRLGWQFAWLRLIVTIFIALVILNSVFGGNFDEKVIHDASSYWIQGHYYVV